MNNREQGFVLLVVLWVLAMLTVISIGFGRRATLDQRAAAYALDHAQAMMMARGAVHRGVILLRNKAVQDAADREHPSVTFHGQDWSIPLDMYKERIFKRREEVEGDTCTFYVRDEQSLFNLNSVSMDILEEIDALDRSILRRIRDRRTKGDREGEGPAAFHAIEELRYIRDVDEEDWFGQDDEPGLKDLFTTVGSGQVNINTASRAVLEALPDMDGPAVNAILGFRKGADGKLGTPDDLGFWDWEDLAAQTGISGDAMDSLKQFGQLNSTCFTVTGIATRRNGLVRASVTATVEIAGARATILDWREEPLGA